MLAKHGLDWLSHSDSPWRVLALPKKWFKHRPERTQAERVRLAIEELGTTYIKLGQAISTRTDLLPPEYIVELSKLQDDAPSIPYEEVRKVIESELGESPELLFKCFEKEPEAAASIGQVHRAVLFDGTEVVVKVQRPGTSERVEQDLAVLKDFAQLVTANTNLGRRYDFLGWLEEFAFTIRNELDFRREGRNADRIRENFLDDPDLIIPKIFWKYTSKKVIVMQMIRGIKLSDADALERANVDKLQLARTCARIVLTEIFRHGFFHADPHPGNFFVFPDGKIAMIDLGMVGRLDEATRESLMRVTLDLAHEDADALVDELLILGVPRAPVRRQDLRIQLDKLIQTYVEGPPEDFSVARLLNGVLAIAAKHRIHVPNDLLFLAKTIAMCEGLSTMLDSNFKLVDYLRSFLEAYMHEMRQPSVIQSRLKANSVDMADLALTLPKKARRLFGQLERGEITFVARLEEGDKYLRGLQRAANRLSTAVVLASLIVGLSYVISRSPNSGFITTMYQLILLALAVVGIGLIVSTIRSKENSGE